MSSKVHRTPTITIVRDPTKSSLRQKSTSLNSGLTPLANIVPQEALSVQRKKEFDVLDRLYAFKEGELPDNPTIEGWLRNFYQATKIDTKTKPISGDGRKLLDDFRSLIKVFRRILREKNGDEKIQHFVNTLITHGKNVKPEGIPKPQFEDNQALKKDATKAYQAMLSIAHLMTTNHEFQKLLQDITVILRDMFGDVAHFIGDAAKPPEQERLRAYDMDQFSQDYDHQEYNENATETGSALEGSTVGQPNRRTIPTQPHQKTAHDQGSYLTEMLKPIRQSKFPNHQGDHIPHQGELYDEHAHEDDRQYQRDSEGGYDGDAIPEKGVRLVRNNLIPENQRDKFDRHLDRTTRYVQDKLSPRTRQSLIKRLKRIVFEVQRDQSYQEAVGFLFDVVSNWTSRAVEAGGEAKKTGKRLRKDQTLSEAQTLLKQLVEVFAQNKSLDPLEQALGIFLDHVQKDPELQKYFKETNQYLQRLLRAPGYLDSDESSRVGNELIDRGQRLLGDKYKHDTDRLISEATDFLNALITDPVTQDLSQRMQDFGKDLFLDEGNKVVFKPHLFHDFRTTLLPLIFQNIKAIPIPRIEYTDKDYDIVVENLVLSSDSFLPDHINIEVQNYISISPTKANQDSHVHNIKIFVDGLHAAVSNVVFYYKKKTGIAHLRDYGSANVAIGRQGISISTMLSLSNTENRLYTVREVHVSARDIKVSIHGVRHDLLYRALKPIVIPLVKTQIERSLEQKVREVLNNLETGLSGFSRMLKPNKRDDFEEDGFHENKKTQRRTSFMGSLFKRPFSPSTNNHGRSSRNSMASSDDDGEYGRSDYGKSEYGRSDYGKSEYGRGEYGRGEHGRGEHGRGEHGRGEHGRDEYGREFERDHLGKDEFGKGKSKREEHYPAAEASVPENKERIV